MNEAIEKLKELVESSEKILITSHISPDPDALCSVLLAGTALEVNYPDKRVLMGMEELTGELGFLSGYEKIAQQALIESLDESQPDLIIIVDAMNFGRCTRGDLAEVRKKVKKLGSRIAIIDHHEPENIEENDIYINNRSPACAQDAYEIFVKEFGARPEGFAQTAMLGIISDTNRFMYDNPRHKDTFDVADELLEAGASIEQLENRLSRYGIDEMQVISELAKNSKAARKFNFSYVSDEFVRQWTKENKSADSFKRGCERFVSSYIRSLGAAYWGFIVYRDLKAGENIYSTSLRSLSGRVDVSKIAQALGGGGHKGAAGAKFEARSVEEAVKIVQDAIYGAVTGT